MGSWKGGEHVTVNSGAVDLGMGLSNSPISDGSKIWVRFVGTEKFKVDGDVVGGGRIPFWEGSSRPF